MKNNKKIIISLMVVMIVLITIIITNYDNTEHTVLKDQEKQISATSSISMMLETGASTGIYEMSSDVSWPTSGYSFNSTLSKCENGSSLSWNSETSSVTVTGNLSDKCYIYFDAIDYSTYTMADVCSSGTSTSECIQTLYNTVGEGTAGIYYFDGSGDYTNSSYEAVDYSYRYVGGDYALTGTATNAGYTTIEDTSSSTNTGVINFYCSRGDSYSYIGASCSSSYTGYFYLNYDENVTQYSTYKEAAEQAVTDGYLTKDNVKNYVCFGSNDETCPDDNLYRIIGWFKNSNGDYEMKIIKADYASSDQLGGSGVGDYASTGTTRSYRSLYKGSNTTYYWYYWSYKNYSTSYSNSGYYNDWSYSYLNTVNLNTNYWGTLASDWQSMVSSHTWIVGGNTTANIYSTTVNNAYSNEIVNYVVDQQADGYTGTVTSTYDANVGLMYVSDYGYAALPTYWTTSLGSYSGTALRESNWLYMGDYEWTISRSSSYTTVAFTVRATGYVGYNDVVSYSNAVRPVLYLVSSTTILSGEGTIDSPYRISL